MVFFADKAFFMSNFDNFGIAFYFRNFFTLGSQDYSKNTPNETFLYSPDNKRKKAA